MCAGDVVGAFLISQGARSDSHELKVGCRLESLHGELNAMAG